MAASYESLRHDRRYEVDARGIAEFGSDRVLRRFIPWYAVVRIDFTHAPQHQQVSWSVREADGSRITPKLGYASSLECYNVALRTWREFLPHKCRMHYVRAYRKFRRAHALIHLFWVIPALLNYTVLGLSYALREEVPWEAFGGLSSGIALGYVACVLQNVLFLKELRLGFDRWYALVEASLTLTEPKLRSAGIFIRDPPLDLPRADRGGAHHRRRASVYRRWEVWSILPFFLLAALLGSAWYLGLRWAASLFNHEAPGTRFLVQASPLYRCIPAIFLGMITSMITLDWLYRTLLRDRYHRYERYCLERVGFDPRRLFVCVVVIFFAGAAVFFLAGVTSYTRFTDAGIEIQRPFSLRSRFYEYARVRAIEYRGTFGRRRGTQSRPLIMSFSSTTENRGAAARGFAIRWQTWMARSRNWSLDGASGRLSSNHELRGKLEPGLRMGRKRSALKTREMRVISSHVGSLKTVARGLELADTWARDDAGK